MIKGVLGALFVLAGIVGFLAPWIVHFDNGFFHPQASVQQSYTHIYFTGIGLSAVAMLGSGITLCFGPHRDKVQIALLCVLLLGTAGLLSAFLVLLFSMA